MENQLFNKRFAGRDIVMVNIAIKYKNGKAGLVNASRTVKIDEYKSSVAVAKGCDNIINGSSVNMDKYFISEACNVGLVIADNLRMMDAVGLYGYCFPELLPEVELEFEKRASEIIERHIETEMNRVNAFQQTITALKSGW